MVTIILVIFSLLSLLIDYTIFRRHIPAHRWLRITYITQAILIDVGTFIYLVFAFFKRVDYGQSTVIIVQYVILLFITSFTVKGIFGTFSLVEFVVSKIRKKQSKTIIYIGSAISLGVLGVMIYGSTVGRSELRVERVVIESDQLPESFDGFRIAQFSDAHLGNLGSNNPLIERMVAKINELNPDIVIQSGDLVNIHSGELTSQFTDQFARLKAPVYAVLGNHDLGYYIRSGEIDPLGSIRDLIQKQRDMGWTLLLNENVWIRRGDDSIAICGVIYPEDNRLGVPARGNGASNLAKAFEGVSDSTFSILISHTPALFDSIPLVAKPNLTISGHVHAMQAKITIGDWHWSPAKWLFPMWSGLYEDRGRYLYINDGLGYALYPMRIGTRPEITLFELKTRKK